MDIKIPLIGSLAVFVLIFLLNLIQGNSFLTLMIRSLISGGLVFGIIFGVIFVLKDILKIDFTASGPKIENPSSEDTRIDYTVGDEDAFENKQSAEEAEAGSEFSSGSDDSFDPVSSVSEESNHVNEMETDNYSSVNFDEPEGKSNNYVPLNKGNSFSDKVGFDASPEDIAKAIRTTMRKDD